jgi:hypothetical protein
VAGDGIPDIPTAGPPTTPAPPGSPPPAPVDTGPISAQVESDLAQLSAIADYHQVSAVVAADTKVVATATARLRDAEAVTAAAVADVRRHQASEGRSRRRLEHLAVAAYTGETTQPVADVSVNGSHSLPVTPAAKDAGVMLTVVMSEQEKQYRARSLATAHAQHHAAVIEARQARAAQALASTRGALATTEATLTTVAKTATGGDATDTMTFAAITTPTGLSSTVGTVAVTPAPTSATTDRTAKANTTTAATSPGSMTASDGTPTPSILGPSTLTAAEIAGWFASTGRTANVTVPIAQLAQDYLSSGTATGVRGDLAFAQSIVETGNFDFPAGGQLTAADNNYAGIGACDSCTTGWTFATPQTGVAAQEELLEAFASPVKVSTPLVGAVGIGGCCRTWVALAGTWASSLTYGVEILTVYKQMLDWAISSRLVVAGLEAPPATTATTAAGASTGR